MVKSRLFSTKGFTLIEVVVTTGIVAVLGAVMYLVFITNGTAYEDQVARAEMLQQANEILEMITDDARGASRFDVANGTNQKELTIVSPGNLKVVYVIKSANSTSTIEVVRNGRPKLLSDQVFFNDSVFNSTGSDLNIKLAMQTATFRGPVKVLTSTEIYSRN